jgi:hypothetical protein
MKEDRIEDIHTIVCEIQERLEKIEKKIDQQPVAWFKGRLDE